MTLKSFRLLYAETIREWLRDDVMSRGAALAFYSVLSIGPLLLIVISIAGLVFGAEAASGRVSHEISGLVGYESAKAVEAILAHSRNTEEGFWAGAIGIITLIVAATGVFGQLQDALNHIWHVKSTRKAWWQGVRKRLLSFAMVLGIGFLLLVSLVISAGLAAVGDRFASFMSPLWLELINFLLSFGITMLLFAMIYRILPDIHIRWRDVWIGAAMTALLFYFGKALIGLYLGQSAVGSTYGAAGSLVVVLVWIYYSAQILFLGAEYTKVYARYAAGDLTEKSP